MQILITDPGPTGTLLAQRLADGGHVVSLDPSGAATRPEVAVAAVSGADDIEGVRRLRRALGEVPLLTLTRVPLPSIAAVEDLEISLMFPGFDAGGIASGSPRPRYPLALPGTVMGPVAGRIRPVDRRLAGIFRAAGIRTALRPDMQRWLTVASAWLGPVRGAIVAAAQQGLALAAKDDLITVAARAARERLLLVRNAGLPLDAGCACLLALPELWAIARIREIAKVALQAPDLPCLPTCEEALQVRERLEPLVREQGLGTPAADFLDRFTREDVLRRSQQADPGRRVGEIREAGGR
jgi:hypothetical protein